MFRVVPKKNQTKTLLTTPRHGAALAQGSEWEVLGRHIPPPALCNPPWTSWAPSVMLAALAWPPSTRDIKSGKKKSGLHETAFFLRKLAGIEDLCAPPSSSAHPFCVSVTVRAALTMSNPTWCLFWAPFGEPRKVSGLGSLGTSSGASLSDHTYSHAYLQTGERKRSAP